jgi:hypothetical protein
VWIACKSLEHKVLSRRCRIHRHLLEMAVIESLPLRQTVWIAENLRVNCPDIRDLCPFFAIPIDKLDCGERTTWTTKRIVSAFFSGAPPTSPTLNRAQSEDLAITSRMCGEARLDLPGTFPTVPPPYRLDYPHNTPALAAITTTNRSSR